MNPTLNLRTATDSPRHYHVIPLKSALPPVEYRRSEIHILRTGFQSGFTHKPASAIIHKILNGCFGSTTCEQPIIVRSKDQKQTSVDEESLRSSIEAMPPFKIFEAI